MINYKKLLLAAVVFACLVSLTTSNIHRAAQSRAKRRPRDDGFLLKYFYKIKTAWLFSIPAALLVGLTGIFPLLIIPVETGHSLKEGVSPKNLKVLLSFAVGGLLGDVFLHLLPEAWMYVKPGNDYHWKHTCIGLWLLTGLLTFLTLEKIFGEEKQTETTEEDVPVGNKELSNDKSDCNGKIPHTLDRMKSNDYNVGVKAKVVESKNGFKEIGLGNGVNGLNGLNGVKKINGVNGVSHSNGFCSIDDGGLKKRQSKQVCNGNEQYTEVVHDKETPEKSEPVKVVGYLNLMANCIDNFTHGLAVSGSFIAGPKIGLCTTIAILLHEIPHEVGDFAILLKSGFNRWDAAKGQMVTAMGGVLGAVFGLVAESAGDSSAWVLPFTSGGFIYIAMVTIVPDLLKETNTKESLKQTVALLAGIGTMALVTALHHY